MIPVLVAGLRAEGRFEPRAMRGLAVLELFFLACRFFLAFPCRRCIVWVCTTWAAQSTLTAEATMGQHMQVLVPGTVSRVRISRKRLSDVPFLPAIDTVVIDIERVHLPVLRVMMSSAIGTSPIPITIDDSVAA
jgi:hypothetical protein